MAQQEHSTTPSPSQQVKQRAKPNGMQARVPSQKVKPCGTQAGAPSDELVQKPNGKPSKMPAEKLARKLCKGPRITPAGKPLSASTTALHGSESTGVTRAETPGVGMSLRTGVIKGAEIPGVNTSANVISISSVATARNKKVPAKESAGVFFNSCARGSKLQINPELPGVPINEPPARLVGVDNEQIEAANNAKQKNVMNKPSGNTPFTESNGTLARDEASVAFASGKNTGDNNNNDNDVAMGTISTARGNNMTNTGATTSAGCTGLNASKCEKVVRVNVMNMENKGARNTGAVSAEVSIMPMNPARRLLDHQGLQKDHMMETTPNPQKVLRSGCPHAYKRYSRVLECS